MARRVAQRYLQKKARTYSRIVIYDFDGTLFRSWDKSPQWWEGSPLDTGPHSFTSLPESLSPPCIPENPSSQYWVGNALTQARRDTADAGTLAVLVTGRVKAHRPRIKKLLGQQGLHFDHLYFNPGMPAVRYKGYVLKSLLALHPMVQAVEVWENENLPAYAQVLTGVARHLGMDIEVTLHPVRKPPMPLSCGPGDFGISR